MEIKITRVGNDGEGIGTYNKKSIFVYYAYKDEIVDVDVKVNRRGAYEGTINEIIKSSPFRVVPPCPYYGRVGTSNLMHIDYLEQLKYKRELVIYHINQKLKNLGRKIHVDLTVPSDDIFNYRNKIDIPVKNVNKKNEMGLYERGTNIFIPITSYVLHRSELDELAQKVLELMDKYKIDAYNNSTKRGYITHLSIRSNEKKEMQLTFILNRDVNLANIVNDLVKENNNVLSIYKTVSNTTSTNRDLLAGDLVKLYGAEYLKMTLANKTFLLAPNAFFQLNTNQALKLFELIVKKANLNKNDIVLDAYSGVGTIATFISPHVKEVVAIERVKAAINALNESNKINKINNIRTITGDVIKAVDKIKTKFSAMIFDPPREGLRPQVLDFILKQKPNKVIYVSCNPETLALDLKTLTQSYNINSVTPVDMFPQISHTESISILTLKEKNKTK